MKDLTADLSMMIQTFLPVGDLIKDMLNKPKSACAQVNTLKKWYAYLQQKSTYNTCPLSHELHWLLGLVTYVSPAQHLEVADIMSFLPLVKERLILPSVETWYTDDSCQGNFPI